MAYAVEILSQLVRLCHGHWLFTHSTYTS